MTNGFVGFFWLTTFLFIPLFAWFVFWWTRNTISVFFNGIVFPFCVTTFFFLLPQIGGITALLCIMGIMFISLIVFFVTHECSPWLQERLQHERKMLGGVNPIWPQHKKGEGQ